MGSNESQPLQLAAGSTNNGGWIAVDNSHPAPLPVIGAKDQAKTLVQEKFPRDYKAYTLRAYRCFNDDSEVYLKLEINPEKTPSVYAYVYLQREKWVWKVTRIENYDFKSTTTNHQISVNQHVMCAVHTLRWSNVTPNQPAPIDVLAAANIARETVETQHHGQLTRCDLMAYKHVVKEEGCAMDFYLKMNIGKCLYVKLVADYHGSACVVETRYHDFSPNSL